MTLLELIGNTPLVQVTRLGTGPCELFLELESLMRFITTLAET